MAAGLPFEYLGPYRLLERIGKGGMGSVYVGQHAKTGETVAIKVIAEHVADEKRFQRRFEDEYRSLATLKHPGIVSVLGSGEHEGRLFYVMQHVQGESLHAKLRREKRLSWREAIDIGIQICLALKHAHDHGFQHRDIKPANVMVSHDGTAKLVDFGIVRIWGNDDSQTAAGSILGTADYMAPEQARGEPVSNQTDLYAVGCVMYAMLSGRAPFRGKNITAVVDAVLRETPVPLDVLVPELPDSLVHLVSHLLEKDRGNRPPTALAVVNRLKAMKIGLERGETHVMEPGEDGGGPTTSSTPVVGRAIGTEEFTGAGLDAPGAPQNSPKQKPSPGKPVPSKPHIAAGTHAAGTITKFKTGGDHNNDANATTPDAGPATIASVGEPAGQNAIQKASDKKASDQKASDQKASDQATQGRPSITAGAQSVDTGGAQSVDTGGPTLIENRDHYQPITDAAGASMFGNDSGDHPPAWRTYSLAAALAGSLAAVVVLVTLAFRGVKPDELYRRAESGDRTAMESFASRYPDDPRSSVIRDRLMFQRVAGIQKRLQTQQRLGITKLSPAESGFLTAIERRDTDPDDTRRRLLGWIAVFDDDSAGKDERDLIELAKFEARRLASQSAVIRLDPRAIDLMTKINNALLEKNTAQTRATLNGVIDTFSDQDWATPAVREAELQLKILEQFDQFEQSEPIDQTEQFDPIDQIDPQSLADPQ